MNSVRRSSLRSAGNYYEFLNTSPARRGHRLLHTDGRSRLSNFWAPTGGITKNVDPATGLEDSHDMLLRAGYIRQSHSGLYQFLPLGQRVQEKVERLLDKHMSRVGASKVSLSTLSSVDLWEQSGRWNADRTEFFHLEDRKQARYLLSPTHEEEITKIVADAVHSYRDLPLRLYQITRKYRDELRPRQGLLRTREFLMKDLYTFDVDRESAIKAYEDVRKAYDAFFDEFKLPYLVANADSGNIGGDFSHEYHFLSKKGEDDVFTCSSCDHVVNGELLASGESGSTCPSCKSGTLQAHTSVELGHTFFLGTKYSEPLNARIQPQDAKKPSKSSTTGEVKENEEREAHHGTAVQMGCYGIGVSRLIATMADLMADAKGLQWPRVMAPFNVVIVPGKGAEDDAAVLHDILGTVSPNAQVDMVLDDRPGRDLVWKLNDADLIGYPLIVVLGRSWKTARKAEVQCRRLGLKQEVDMVDLPAFIRELVQRL